jgi:hypothetical protein
MVWHDMHTKFYDDWYRRSSTINIFALTVLRGYNVITDAGNL